MTAIVVCLASYPNPLVAAIVMPPRSVIDFCHRLDRVAPGHSINQPNMKTKTTNHTTRRLHLHRLFAGALLLGTAALTGCGDGGTDTAAPAKPAGPVAKEVTIAGTDEMKYDKTSIAVSPGQRVKLTFKNVGSMPKEAMGHNWILLRDNADPAKVAESGVSHPDSDYVAPGDQSYVLAQTKVLGPGESETITFTAPTKRGKYPFLCTFPAHFAAGMKGELIVQ